MSPIYRRRTRTLLTGTRLADTALLDYLARIRGRGVQTRDFDPTGRIVVTVTGTSELPVAGAEVALTGNAVGGAQAPVAVDVLFLLDATGSMGDQIIG